MKTMNRILLAATALAGLVSGAMAGVPGSGCAPGTATHGSCTFTFPQAMHAATISVSNTAPGFAGTLSRACLNGEWTVAAATCTPKTEPASPPTGDVVATPPAGWAGGTTTYGKCSYAVAQTAHGASASAATTTAGFSGSIAGTCLNGQWTGVSATCNEQVTNLGTTGSAQGSCPAMPVAPAGGCRFAFPASPNGAAITVQNGAVGRVGEIQGVCQAGSWIVGNYGCHEIPSTEYAPPGSIATAGTGAQAAPTPQASAAGAGAIVAGREQAYVMLQPNGSTTVMVKKGDQVMTASDWLSKGMPATKASGGGTQAAATPGAVASATTNTPAGAGSGVVSATPQVYADVGIRYGARARGGAAIDESDIDLTQRYQPGYRTGRGATTGSEVGTNQQVVDARSNMRAELAAIEEDPSRTVAEKRAARERYDQAEQGIAGALRTQQMIAVERQTEERSAAAVAQKAAVVDLKQRALAQLRLAGVGEGAIPGIMTQIDEESVATVNTSSSATRLTMVNGRLESGYVQQVLERTRRAMAIDTAKYQISEAEWKKRQRRGDPEITPNGALVVAR